MIRLIFLGLIVAAYAAVCVVSPHGFWMSNIPRVEKIADIPEAALPEDADKRVRFGSLQIPTRRPDLTSTPSKIMLGYSYRNFETLKLPFAAYEDQGVVMYAESRKLLLVVPLDKEEQAALVKALGHDPIASYKFPWWKFTWGWPFAAALGIWLIFQYRHEYLVRKRIAREQEAEWEAQGEA